MSARLAAYRLIEKVEGKAYSNLALDGAFKQSSLSERDKAFAARLFYGVCERKLTLEHIISYYSDKPLNALDKQTLTVLKMGVYQLYYMEVPESAAVNESVKLIKGLKKSSSAGFVNAVLRRIVREGRIIPPVKGDVYDKMAVEYSCPAELIKRICNGYGEENTRSLLKASLEPSVCTLRVNTLKTDTEALLKALEDRGIKAVRSDRISEAVICENLKNIEADPDFCAGHFHVQDLSSQLCCAAVDPKSGETVIDICAAPGGKTFTMAEMMGNEGRIFACELHEKRTDLIKKGAERLGITCIEALTNDGRVHNDSLPTADRVLCDVPCSGYGVIRGKPEIRYKPLSEADRLPGIQLDILRTAAGYVKDGGVLVYSTCTVNIEENERVIEKFLAERSDFQGDDFPESMGEFFRGKFMTAIFSGNLGGDGFFICRLKKG